ncbi:hypothetical protein PPL_08888 [Heterostelium album PN500]|uniref:BTB domain-containing protein n=1 Tax=Heterostelium pallidum (strain ATCC 26659 / Pp 5 / PN500) TaxID=670386 RepID=D3BK07_HETP5|nr:hypothetical protein PPL_08888 [Heterostelium album PN500]EFA78237.1 hypothetical protein PPL_08888 [Heterostelium album PN500]|eukprot:XP_020430362.1 hypothetical protein PPL_08888 [Heterostelium album PN500]
MKEDLLRQLNNINNSNSCNNSSYNLNSSGVSSITSTSSNDLSSFNNFKGCSICKCPHHQQQQLQEQHLQLQQALYNNKNNESLVKLNVGGQRFITTRDTLLSKGENFFSSLLNGCIPSFKDEKGYIFIDRNGRYFNFILEYLRTGFVDISQDIKIEAIFREADFYCIHGFQLQWLAQQLHKSAAVSRAASSSRMIEKDNNEDDETNVVNNVVNIINDVNNHHVNHHTNTTVRRRQLSNQDLRWSLGALVERLLKI